MGAGRSVACLLFPGPVLPACLGYVRMVHVSIVICTLGLMSDYYHSIRRKESRKLQLRAETALEGIVAPFIMIYLVHTRLHQQNT